MQDAPDDTFDLDVERIAARYANRIAQAELEAEIVTQRLEAVLTDRARLVGLVEELESRLAALEERPTIDVDALEVELDRIATDDEEADHAQDAHAGP